MNKWPSIIVKSLDFRISSKRIPSRAKEWRWKLFQLPQPKLCRHWQCEMCVSVEPKLGLSSSTGHTADFKLFHSLIFFQPWTFWDPLLRLESYSFHQGPWTIGHKEWIKYFPLSLTQFFQASKMNNDCSYFSIWLFQY